MFYFFYFSVLTRVLEDKKKGTNSKIWVCPLGWSRRESNPRPNKVFIRFLHAYFRITCRETAGPKQTNRFRSSFKFDAAPEQHCTYLKLYDALSGTT